MTQSLLNNFKEKMKNDNYMCLRSDSLLYEHVDCVLQVNFVGDEKSGYLLSLSDDVIWAYTVADLKYQLLHHFKHKTICGCTTYYGWCEFYRNKILNL